MGFAAARGKGTGNPKDDDLLAGAEVGDVDLVAGGVLEQVHGGDGGTNGDRRHCTHAKVSAEIS